MRFLVLLAAAFLLLSGGLLSSCKSVPGADGRYATPSRGGWDNFRG